MKSSISVCPGSWGNRVCDSFLQMLFKMLLSPLDLFCLFPVWVTRLPAFRFHLTEMVLAGSVTSQCSANFQIRWQLFRCRVLFSCVSACLFHFFCFLISFIFQPSFKSTFEKQGDRLEIQNIWFETQTWKRGRDCGGLRNRVSGCVFILEVHAYIYPLLPFEAPPCLHLPPTQQIILHYPRSHSVILSKPVQKCYEQVEYLLELIVIVISHMWYMCMQIRIYIIGSKTNIFISLKILTGFMIHVWFSLYS